jgi:predicted Fe-S protein YdhL (DUF1289 family)
MNTVPSATPPSPCVKICELDAAQVCVGCGRSIGEIAEWGGAPEARKHQILERAAQRRRSRETQGNQR